MDLLRTALVSMVLLAGVPVLGALEASSRPVFPGAVGFGTDTPAGRGGQVLRVTNLDPAGPGSLRSALGTAGPRIVVFEVGGVLDLNGKGLSIGEPFCTVAGETAPSPGITIVRGGLGIGTHDVLVRHIRVRPGDAGRAKRSGWEPDGISVSGGKAYNVVIDHCSVTWAVDENVSASGPRTAGPEATAHRVTISNCIIAEGLDDSSHKKGRHSKGSLIHDFCQDIAIIGNLYAHNVRRNPFFKAHTTGVVANNLIYNPGSAAVQMSYSEREWRKAKIRPRNGRISVVGNVMIHGADTKRGLALIARQGDAFYEDNVALARDGEPVAVTQGKISRLPEKPVWPDGFTARPSDEVIEHVTVHVGARPRDRDGVDLRILRDFRVRRGRIIDSQEEVGGYPDVAATRRTLQVPDQEVDAWLSELAAEVE